MTAQKRLANHRHHEASDEEPNGGPRETSEGATSQVVAAHMRNRKCVLHEIDLHAPLQALQRFVERERLRRVQESVAE